MRLVRSHRARRDLQDIWEHIHHDRPGSADAVAERIDGRCRNLTKNPYLGVARPDIRPVLRVSVVGNYLIFYSVDRDEIRIVRIIHGKRDLKRLL